MGYILISYFMSKSTIKMDVLPNMTPLYFYCSGGYIIVEGASIIYIIGLFDMKMSINNISIIIVRGWRCTFSMCHAHIFI